MSLRPWVEDECAMRVGVIDLLVDNPVDGYIARLYATYFRRQFVSIGPQAVAAWCRQLGHDTHYATYWGQADPRRLLPSELDIVFIAVHTPKSALAYALAKLFRRERATTVIGGPHAKAYPEDCRRFFDIVVKDCDKNLVDDIVRGRVDKPAIVTSGRGATEIPGVEDRSPEIEVASFGRGQPTLTSVVPMLASVGCPYSCDFCIDWDSKYVPLSRDRLRGELLYISRRWPRAMIGYHDPNFGVRFDETMEVIESLPPNRRNRYIMESSLAILKDTRMPRLRTTNCVYVAPGIESWQDYSNKAGVGAKTGLEKLDRVVAHIHRLADFVPGIQANVLVGIDGDRGKEPIELTKEFIRRVPQAWPTINIPTPFGGTPLFDQYLTEGRILKAMPFGLYYNPYIVFQLKHYEPVEYYDHLISIQKEIASNIMFARRMATRIPNTLRLIHGLRTFSARTKRANFAKLRTALVEDPQVQAFHAGRDVGLPKFYENKLRSRLGRYGDLLSSSDLTPELGSPTLAAGHRGSQRQALGGSGINPLADPLPDLQATS